MSEGFDRVFDRSGTDSIKWNFYEQDGAILEWSAVEPPYSEDGVLPMWIADMDFRSPEPVVDALVERARHGLYGYTGRSRAYDEAVTGWLARRYGWTVDPAWITVTPGVVNALFNLVPALTEPGEKVLIMPPVYHPFTHAVEKNDRVPARVPLVLEDGRYRIDFDLLEETARDPAVKLAIHCSPHNPVGRVWKPEELRRFGTICAENGVIVISDEVFGDLVYPGVEFTSFAASDPAFEGNAVVCTSPSKTFNLPGLKTSNIVIPNKEIRSKFNRQLDRNGIYGMSAFGNTAVQAAYREGEPWLSEVMVYIEANFRFLRDTLAMQLPEVRVIRPEGTYLGWADFRPLGVEKGFCRDRLLYEAGVYLSDGAIFGPEGEGFARFNLACPRAILAEALDRITTCLS